MQLSSLFKNELAIVTGGLIKFTLLSRVVLQFEIAPQPPNNNNNNNNDDDVKD
jgi:hypothetical protein